MRDALRLPGAILHGEGTEPLLLPAEVTADLVTPVATVRHPVTQELGLLRMS